MRLVDRVAQALQQAGLRYEVMELDESTATAPLASQAVGSPLGSIVKSLLFMAAGEPLLVLVAGDHKADNTQIARLLGIGKKRVRFARQREVEELAGCAPGGVPPIAHNIRLSVLIDSSLSRFDTVWAAAGAPNALFPIGYADLLELTGGRVADIARPLPAPESSASLSEPTSVQE